MPYAETEAGQVARRRLPQDDRRVTPAILLCAGSQSSGGGPPRAGAAALPGQDCQASTRDRPRASRPSPPALRSLNYDNLSSCKKFRVYHAEVTEQWPLHFSLVNINVSDEYGQLEQGYRKCQANIEVTLFPALLLVLVFRV